MGLELPAGFALGDELVISWRRSGAAPATQPSTGGTTPAGTLPVRVIPFANPGSTQPAEAAAYQTPVLGRVLFPPSPATAANRGQSLWNLRVDALPVHAQSATWLSTIGATPGSNVRLRPDFTAASYGAGIPINVASSTTKLVPVTITDFINESDVSNAGYPIPDPCFVEHPGDSHLIVVDKDAWIAWEFYNFRVLNGVLTAMQVSKWDLKTDASRTPGWTSADAAGCSVLAGLVRYDEVDSGVVNHAFRFTCKPTDHAALLPATHYAASANRAAPPMGARLRLKAAVDISKLPGSNTATTTRVRAILTAMKNYGLIVADNGNPYVTGCPDARWSDDEMGQLKSFTIDRDFEFCDAGVALVTQF